ncbi:MAG TPA: CRTAC1 family protein [Candidatus Polarisedimenticolaceae bacterium]|nr:CRTAC1 family protein [Candidatus Polarisedimenticolaceae bacterium]
MAMIARVTALSACLFVLASASTTGPLHFVDATAGAGIDYVNVCGAPLGKKGWLNEGMGAGAAWLDYDADGKLDLYVVNGSAFDRKPGAGEPNRLFRGDGTGKFADVSVKAGVADRGWGYGVTVGDYDNDGDADLFVTNMGPNVLYRNRGDGTFEDVTARAGVAGDDVWSSSAAFFDMDRDGDLDLYVGNYMVCSPTTVARAGSPEAIAANCVYYGVAVPCGPMSQVPIQDVLYRNDGDGTFSDVTRAAGLWLDTARYALGVVTFDYDNDGDQDVYVANDSVANSLWENDGKGRFTDVGLIKLAAFNAHGRAQAGMGADAGDYNGDGWMDLVVTNFSQDLNTIYKNLAGKFFIDDSNLAGMNVTHMFLSWGVGFHDFDLDGDLDLFIANGHVYPMLDGKQVGTNYRQPNHLFLNDGDRFVESAARSGPGLALERSFRGAAFADYDDDGDVDVFLTALDDAPQLLRNDSPRAGRHYLTLRLIGQTSNRDGVGARVTTTIGSSQLIRERKGGGSYQSASDPRVHFGVGSATVVDRIEVRWPSGVADVLSDVPVDRELTIVEGQSRD